MYLIGKLNNRTLFGITFILLFGEISPLLSSINIKISDIGMQAQIELVAVPDLAPTRPLGLEMLYLRTTAVCPYF